MWVESDEPSNSRSSDGILSEEFLLPMNDVDLKIVGDDFQIERTPESYSKSQRVLLEEMITLYNLCGKINKWRQESPIYALAQHPKLRELLLNGRTANQKYKGYLELLKAGDDNKMIADSFISSRTLRFGVKRPEGPSTCLMPIVDIYNHNNAGARYQVNNDIDGSREILEIARSMVTPGSKECYARYSMLDAQDSFTAYGYVDTTAGFVRSAPMTIQVEGIGTLQVNSTPGNFFKESLPESERDLKMFIPHIAKNEPGEMVVSHLLLPSKNSPRALVRTLSFLVRRMHGVSENQTIAPLVRAAEVQVVRRNKGYLSSLRKLLNTPTVRADDQQILRELDKLVSHQSEIIDEYISVRSK